MKLSRRLFATLIFAVAPFVGASVLPPPEIHEPDAPKEQEVEAYRHICVDPFDVILADCLGMEKDLQWPKDCVWVNGFGWVDAAHAAPFVALTGGRLSDLYTSVPVTPRECAELICPGPTNNPTNHEVVDPKKVRHEMSRDGFIRTIFGRAKRA